MFVSNTIVGESQSQQAAFSKECPSLLTHYFEQINKGSGIGVDVIRQRGYESILGKKHLANLGFSKAQQRPPGLLYPRWGVDAQKIPPRYRPDSPRVTLLHTRKIKRIIKKQSHLLLLSFPMAE